MSHDPTVLPPNLPAPIDDGAADHLRGASLPAINLNATFGGPVQLNLLRRAVVFIYPRTGVPGKSPGETWDLIPGARGCTPQSCGFRDLSAEFAALGVDVFGLSTQTTEFQREFAGRMHIPFPILSDSELRLTHALRLPTFEYNIEPLGGGGPTTLLKRMAWYIEQGTITHVWYPVFPPNTNAQRVLDWLREHRPA